MRILTSSLLAAIGCYLLSEANSLARATVCRQRLWRRATEVITHELTTSPEDLRVGQVSSCALRWWRGGSRFLWARKGATVPRTFSLELRGKL